MNYKFFANSEKAWKSMFEAMAEAKKSIYLEMYIFQNNVEDFDFFNLLKQKAKKGLKVKLIVDSVGSSELSEESILELKESGVEILFLSYFFHRMHRKILIVDERVAFVGGVNIHNKYRFWNDLMVRIKGELVQKIVKSFSKSYANASGVDPVILKNKKKIEKTKMKMKTWLIEHFPIKNKFAFKRIYKKYINKSQNSLTLVTPYFIPKRWLSGALHQAILRGVNVEILVPVSTDHFFVDRVNYFYIYKLSKLGVKFYIEPKMNHAKALIIDEKEGMIGSQNIDFMSFNFNSEIGIFFEDEKVISELLEITEVWKHESVLFDYRTYKPRWFDYILSPLISFFFFVSRIFLD